MFHHSQESLKGRPVTGSRFCTRSNHGTLMIGRGRIYSGSDDTQCPTVVFTLGTEGSEVRFTKKTASSSDVPSAFCNSGLTSGIRSQSCLSSQDAEHEKTAQLSKNKTEKQILMAILNLWATSCGAYLHVGQALQCLIHTAGIVATAQGPRGW